MIIRALTHIVITQVTLRVSLNIKLTLYLMSDAGLSATDHSVLHPQTSLPARERMIGFRFCP